LLVYKNNNFFFSLIEKFNHKIKIIAINFIEKEHVKAQKNNTKA
jgi:hypothetical protein